MKTLMTAAALTLAAAGADAQTSGLPAGDEWSQAMIEQYIPALADETLFIKVDRDGNGSISRNELQVAMDEGLL